MMIAFGIAGVGAVLAGLLAILVGLPVKEFSFGNTLILAGVIGICTGLIILALSVVVGELKLIARRLGARAETHPRPVLAGAPPAHHPAAGEDGFLFSRDQAAHDEAGHTEAPPSAPPWRDEAVSRGRQDEVSAPELAEPAPKPKRNLLFSSTSRKERERAHGRAADSSSPEARPAPPIGPPVPEESEGQPATFDDAWPKSERASDRARPPEMPLQRRSGRSPTTLSDANPPERPAPSVPPAEEPAVTVLKSGVVDGMAYSLYSDGSIEAQMPEGMMRFASIDELRAHLDQRP